MTKINFINIYYCLGGILSYCHLYIFSHPAFIHPMNNTGLGFYQVPFFMSFSKSLYLY